MALIALRRRRRAPTVGATLLLLVAACLVLVGPGAAHAANCTPQVHEPAVGPGDGTSRASYDFASQCSDGNSRIWGTVSDPLCDMRAAQLQYEVWDRNPDGTYRQIINYTFSVSNGCGTSSTFSRTAASPGQVGWRLRVSLRACNSSGCSRGGSINYYG